MKGIRISIQLSQLPHIPTKMPVTDFSFKETYEYQNGFHCYHETEAVEGALPIGISFATLLLLRHILTVVRRAKQSTKTGIRSLQREAIRYSLYESAVGESANLVRFQGVHWILLIQQSACYVLKHMLTVVPFIY